MPIAYFIRNVKTEVNLHTRPDLADPTIIGERWVRIEKAIYDSLVDDRKSKDRGFEFKTEGSAPLPPPAPQTRAAGIAASIFPKIKQSSAAPDSGIGDSEGEKH